MQIPWYSFLDDAHFAMLMEPDTGMHPVLGLHKPHLYQFPEDKLPVIQAVNPALFIHGVLHNRALRESPLANKWFVPMLEATFQKTLLNSSYVFDLMKPRENSAEQAKRFDNMLKQFAPEYMRLLPVYQSLHAGDVAYTKWAEGCARSLMAQNEAVAFPDLGDISEHTP